VTGEGHHVDVHFIYVQLDLTQRLRGISVEECFVLAAKCSYLFQWLDDADLIVYRHN
jgi:hypothetical protein